MMATVPAPSLSVALPGSSLAFRPLPVVPAVDVLFQSEEMRPPPVDAQGAILWSGNPVPFGRYATQDIGRRVVVEGDFAFVAGLSSLHQIDVRDPSKPVVEGWYDDTNAFDVAVSGNLVYVADPQQGLLILGMGPGTMPLIGSYPSASGATAVAVDGHYAYVACSDDGLKVIDVRDPENPTLAGGNRLRREYLAITVSGDHAYAAASDHGLIVFDIGNVGEPTMIGTYHQDDPRYGAFDVAVQGNRAYLAVPTIGLQILDVSDPARPGLLGAFRAPGGAGIAVSGNIAYLNGTDALRVIDVEDPSQPALVGSLEGESQGWGVCTLGRRIFASEESGGLKLLRDDAFVVDASDDLFEDGVHVSWNGNRSGSVYLRLLRDGQLLTLVAGTDSTYMDATAVPGDGYDYCLEIRDVATDGVLDTACDPGRRIIFAPTSVEASDGTFEEEIRITWVDRSSVEAGYRIDRKVAGEPDNTRIVIGTAGPNRELYRDASADSGVTYSYCVRAYDAEDNVSVRRCDQGTRGYVLPPLAVSASDGQFTDKVALTWQDQTDQEIGYNVYRDDALLFTAGRDSEGYDDVGGLGQQHVYCVRTLRRIAGQPDSIDVESAAVCDSGRGGPATLAAPIHVAASDGLFDDRVTITWEDPPATADQFQILRDQVLITTLAGSKTSYDDRDAVPGTVASYCVVALSDSGGSSPSACDTGQRAIVVPPTNVTASDGDYEERVDLAWESASTSAVLFRIYRDGDPIQVVTGTGRSYSDREVDSGAEHEYCVRAVSALGELSVPVCDAGHRTIAPPGSVEASDNAFEDRIEITWEDASQHEAGYEIRRRRGNQPFTQIGTTAANRTAYVDTTAATNVSYDYRVRAFDEHGSSSLVEDEGSRLMLAPASVAASDGEYEKQIVVTWVDKSFVEDGYRVSRDDGVEFALPPNSSSYTDEAITFGAEYTYSVTAYDNNGGAAEASDDGKTAILPPGSVSASDTYDGKVIVTWIDRSEINGRYRVFRDGSHYENVGDVQSFVDDNVSPGVTYEYCVRASIAGYGDSEGGCDTGLAPVTTPEAGTPEFALQSRLQASDGVVGDRFGFSVAIDGDLALVGSFGWGGDNTGAVYCFKRDPATNQWAQIDVLRGISGSQFGKAVAISGNHATVGGPEHDDGATDTGAIWGYKFNGSDWDFSYYRKGDPNTRLGESLAMEGDLLIVGAPGGIDGAAQVRRRDGDDFNLVATLDDQSAGSGAEQGASVALEGDWIVVGAPEDTNANGDASGLIYLYQRGGTDTWTRTLVTTGRVNGNIDSHDGDRYGSSVSLRGNQLIVGAPRDDSAGTDAGASYVWDITTDFTRQKKLLAPDGAAGDFFGWNVAMGSGIAFVGGGDDARQLPVYVFKQGSAGGWTEKLQLKGSESIIGDLAVDASRLFIGTDGWDSAQGYAYEYDINPAPAEVAASDGAYTDKIQVRWQDTSQYEDGFRLYRDGSLLETLAPNTTSYNDLDSEQDGVTGLPHEYCVSSFSDKFGESEQICDFGHRPPNGAVNGRVATRTGAPVDSAEICVDPSPGRAILFDGAGGALRFLRALPSTAFTMELWVNSGAPGTQAGTILSYATFSQINTVQILDYRNAKVVINNGAAWTTGENLADGQWHHVALTWQASNGAAQLYVDGSLSGSHTFGTAPITAGTLVLGQKQTVLGGGFSANEGLIGRLDEFRVWDHVRTGVEILASMSDPLEGDEQGLVVYLPLDEGEGTATADLTGGDRYGELIDGAYWSDEISPVDVCALTDTEGNYTFTRLRYRSGNSMRLTPRLDPRQFEPAFKTISLSLESPVQNEVGFTDITSYGISGTVAFQGLPCFVPNVPIYLDGTFSGSTDAAGRFSISATPGVHTIEPLFEDHVFTPSSRTIDLQGDLAGLDFVDTIKRNLTGHVGGGCDREIGLVTLEIATEDGCYSTTIETRDEYAISLAPQKYMVHVADIEDVPDALDRVDVLKFFNDLGPQAVDLTLQPVVMDFLYRAPLGMEIVGFPAAPGCGPITDPETGVEVQAVPIIPQGEAVALTISVYEDYGNGNTCPVDSGTVSIFDEIIDQADTPTVLSIKNGMAQYTTVGNYPNIFVGRKDSNGNDRSFQKPLTAVAEVKGRPTLTRTEWVIVTGDKPRTGTFVSAAGTETPTLVLHDPPGDGSAASLAKETSSCMQWSDIGLESLSGTVVFKLKAGVKFSKGIGFMTETDVKVETSQGFELGIEATQQGDVELCTTTSETFSTSDSDGFIGQDADVFVGAATNLLFAKTDVLDVVDCEIRKSQTVRMGADGDKPFETVYVYTKDHIQNTVIPQLHELAILDPDNAGAYQDYIENWEAHLALSESMINLGLNSPIDPVENRSFSAGANYEYSRSTKRAESFQWGVKVFANSEQSAEFGFEESGNGVSLAFGAKMNFEYTRQETSNEENTVTTGYTLVDDDSGDYFSVDVGIDPVFGTPVFGLRSGRSSCPFEPGTQPRDSVIVAVEPPVRNDVPVEDPAVFTLSITNASPSEEDREYVLTPIQTSNPGGALLEAGGTPFITGESFNIASGRTQEVTLTVERGPRRYFYDGLQVMVSSPCDPSIADTATFRVGFAAPCSDITLFEPQPGWTFNRAESEARDDTLRLTLDDFQLQISERDSLKSIGAEYRAQGTDALPFLIDVIDQKEIPRFPNGDPKSAEILWNVAGVPDGSYEVRAYTRCEAGKGYSSFATGRIDRKPPKMLAAQPSDQVLSLGDEIAITFDEGILCNTVNTQTVKLFVQNQDDRTPIEIEAVCDGRKIVINPIAPALGALEERTLVARIQGIHDLANNPMEGPNGSAAIEWSFVVRRKEFAWSQASVLKDAAFESPGSIANHLVNGRPDDVNFVLQDVPDWLTPSTTGNVIRAGESMPITFAIDETLPIGTYTDSLEARIVEDGSTALLAIRVDVQCLPPEWEVNPSGFEANMAAVVQLSIDGAVSRDTADVVVAMVGNQVRGIAHPRYVPEVDRYLAFVTIGSNRAGGEKVRFRIWDDSACHLYRTSDQIVSYVKDQIIGSPQSPLTVAAVDFPAGVAQTIPVNAGWNWFSLNLFQIDMSPDGVLGDLNPSTGDLVKGRNVFDQFDEEAGWTGTLAEFNNQSMYAVKISEAGTIIHEGEPKNDPIPIANKWNWIAYLPQAPLPVNDALQNLDAGVGDVVKSQDAFAQVVPGGQWVGSLETMEPGRGYKLYRSSVDNAVLLYPVAPPAKVVPAADSSGTAIAQVAIQGSAATKLAKLDPDLTFDPADYQFDMTVTATVLLENGTVAPDGCAIGAFVGNQLRGVGAVEYIPTLEKYLIFLMVHSNEVEGETVVFRAYPEDGASPLLITETIIFGADRVVGQIGLPFTFHTSGVDATALPASFSLGQNYPNPMRPGKGGAISYSLPTRERVLLEVYDLSGRAVSTLVDEEKPAGRHVATIDPQQLPSGLYFYRIAAGSFDSSKRLMVVK